MPPTWDELRYEMVEALEHLFALNPEDPGSPFPYIHFTRLFRTGLEILNLEDLNAATAFGTSTPNIRRWRDGSVTPPAALPILRLLLEELKRCA